MSEATRGDRVYQVRRALGPDERHEMSQRDFARLLTRAAKRLAIDASYDSSAIARIETNERRLHVDDITLIAAVDPKKRGREWLGWGESPIVLLDPNLDRGLTEAEEERALAAGKNSKARRKRPKKGDAGESA